MPRPNARPLRHRLALAVVPLAVVAVAGCGGSDDGGSAGGEPTSSSAAAEPTAAEQTVIDWLEATVEGDVAACDLETEDFSELANELTEENLTEGDDDPISCEKRIKRAAQALSNIAGEEYEEQIRDAEVVTTDESDDAATVEVTYEDGAEPTVFGLVMDGEDWLIDSDSAFPDPSAAPESGTATG